MQNPISRAEVLTEKRLFTERWPERNYRIQPNSMNAVCGITTVLTWNASSPVRWSGKHVVILGERHLRRILTLYSLYYNETRTHLGLAKDAPLRRFVQRSGTLIVTPILSGLHHCYARI